MKNLKNFKKMKNIKNIKNTIVLLAIALISVSCIVDDENDNGFQSSEFFVGFAQKTATNSYFADEGVVRKEYPINFLGGQSGVATSSDITINFAVNTALSTATEGVEFDLPLSGSLTLPAGSNFVQFPLDINTGNFDPVAPTSVFIDLSSGTPGAQVSDINKTIEIKFVGCLSTIDQHSYQMTFDYTNLDGDFFNDVNGGVQSFTLDPAVPNRFSTESTPPWSPGQLAPGADAYIFEVVCGEVFITTQNLGGYWANTVESRVGETNPAGSVDANGNVFISYDVCYGGDCRVLDVTYTKL